MNNYAQIYQAYVEVGILGLLAILVIILIWRSYNRKGDDDKWKNSKIDNKDFLLENDKQTTNKQLEQLTEILVKQQEKFIDKVITGVNYHVPTEEENTKLTKINTDIDVILQDILLETQASRVALVQYHNGGKGINKQAFLKMSMTNEKIQLGIKPFMQDFKDQFRSVLGYFVNTINLNSTCDIPDTEEMKYKDIGMYEFLKNRNIASEFGYGIKNKENTIIGFICVEYQDTLVPDLDKVHTSLKEHYKEIERLLNA